MGKVIGKGKFKNRSTYPLDTKKGSPRSLDSAVSGFGFGMGFGIILTALGLSASAPIWETIAFAFMGVILFGIGFLYSKANEL